MSTTAEPYEIGSLIRRLWRYCGILRDDGLSYPDYVEQLTYLLFLKMSDEIPDGPVPAQEGWQSFAHLQPEAMRIGYISVLERLGSKDGLLGLIFKNARCKIRDARKLSLLVVDLIGQIEWVGLSNDLKGDAYEGLLEKNARDTKSGAGQYFTPRSLVRAIVKCVNPQPGEVILDPACGTGGFLLAANDHIRQSFSLTESDFQRLRYQAFRGVELVEEVARLGAMNLLLHGIGGSRGRQVPITCADSLSGPIARAADVILTNPPFGARGSVKRQDGDAEKAPGCSAKSEVAAGQAEWVVTSNKQLDFLQRIALTLRQDGRAAVVLPDNVLFEGGAAAAIRRKLLEGFDVHTLLRLPRGLFYAQGVSANVLFFDSSTKDCRSKDIWVYDLRANNKFSLRSKPLGDADLAEFVQLYGMPDRSRVDNERWRRFSISKILETKDVSLDIDWSFAPEDGGSAGLKLDELSLQIAEDLHKALIHIGRVAAR